MGNIVLLDDLTINKIAAGEVIERPASVVKEMVENSIDAGATNILVEIKNGGISYIRITDNGKGIARDDLEIAFERHATSKIRSAEDLSTVTSMGFRGEALASIAAISNVELISRTEDEDIGYKVEIEGGKVLNKQEVGCQKGTIFTVTNLFYNTPVRYKFLKKDFTEAGYIEDVITRIALVHPEIAIKLINCGKTIIQTNGNNDIKAVIYSIYGKEISDNILNVDYEYEDIKVKGVIGKPNIARSNRSNQLFFVNNRYIKDKSLTSAAEQGYKGLITIGKYGFLILNLEINPQKVDVNVHPAKLEVRFEDEGKVFKAVYHAIKDTLLKGDLVSDPVQQKSDESKIENAFKFNNVTQEIKTELPKANEYTEQKIEEEPEIKPLNSLSNLFKKFVGEKKEKIEETENVIEQVYNKHNNIDEIKKEPDNLEDKGIQNIQVNKQSEPANLQETNEIFMKKMEELNKLKIEEKNPTFDEMYVKTFGKMPLDTNKVETVTEKQEDYKIQDNDISTAENISIFSGSGEQIPPYKFIGIAFSTYIIIEMDKDLYIIDQHAAHERIMYERIKENYYSDSQKDSQLMLLPDIINLTHKEMDIAKDNMEMFRKAGFTVEEFGENTIKLSGVPNICIDMDTKELFLETLDEINSVARTAKQEIEEKFISTVACKAAVKANMALTKEEVDNLMKQLLVLNNPFTCPHGRPTAIKMTKTDIEKKFSRR